MKPTSLVVLGLAALATAAIGQYSYTVYIPAPGSQTNGPAASMVLSGGIADPSTPQVSQALLTAAGGSATLAWVIQASIPAPGPSTVFLTGSLGGGAGAPLALAVSFVPGGIFCGGFAGWPCATGPYLPSSVVTPGGIYHLTDLSNPPFLLWDGIGLGLNPAPPASLDSSGTFPLAGQFPVGVPAPQGTGHYAFQAVMLDPGSAAGFRFTAALTIQHWDFYL